MAPSIEQREDVSDGGSRAKGGTNVWIVPIAFISHVRCFLQFAKQLARHGVTVTFFCTKDDAERTYGCVNAMLESWTIEGLDIHLKFLDVNRQELADGENGGERWGTVINELEESFEVILKHELYFGESKPTCVISDYWTPGVHVGEGQENTTFQLGFSLHLLWLIQELLFTSLSISRGILKLPSSHLDKIALEELISLPGLPLLRLCEELETRALREMKRLLQNAAKNEKREVGQIYTVGPTFPFALKGARCTPNAAEDQDSRHPCLKFLDGQAESSVLYVAFGNDWNHTPEQMQEIAYGLESSQQPFLCVFHAPRRTAEYPSGDMFDVIPPDCVTRTRDRGLFVPALVPQREILAHPSIGSFLSHCGQNSVLESISMGVPLLTWPLLYDQMFNARSVVDENVAFEIAKSPDNLELVDRTEVETKVRALFHTEEGRTVRNNAQRMRELALKSVAENGSSYKNMQALVARINRLAA